MDFDSDPNYLQIANISTYIQFIRVTSKVQTVVCNFFVIHQQFARRTSASLLLQVVISPDIFDYSSISQFQARVEIRSQISPAGFPAFGHRAVDEDLEVDLANLRVSIVPQIPCPRLALDHHQLLEFHRELDQDDGGDESFLWAGKDGKEGQ